MGMRGPASAPTSVHFEVWILTQPLNFNQLGTDTDPFEFFALFSPPVPAPLPDGTDHGLEMVHRRPFAQ